MTKAGSNRGICFIKAVLLLCEHGHFFEQISKWWFLPPHNTIRVKWERWIFLLFISCNLLYLLPLLLPLQPPPWLCFSHPSNNTWVRVQNWKPCYEEKMLLWFNLSLCLFFIARNHPPLLYFFHSTKCAQCDWKNHVIETPCLYFYGSLFRFEITSSFTILGLTRKYCIFSNIL